ncbi:unnamed protein product [Macrosiphum euphorbiae]|uniref:MADF domain-containing protein n=1 Tax=Macrosiphum euphorbiae TaxID=13131 RepID=A0AAV0Y6B6_9HEMI|nr:unnamed protein product [Macrosiphum euphorbiae]
MAMSEEQLIVLVQQYKHLYDISDSNYHNNLIKDNSWEEIGKMLSTTGEACKNKWKSLRESYRKAMNARKTKSGQSGKKIRPWRLESQMEFVKSYLFSQSEEAMSNFSALSPSSPTTDSNDLSSITNELLETEENEEELKNHQSDKLEDSVNNQNNKQLFSIGKKSEIGTDKPGTAAKLLHQYMQMKMSASSNPRPLETNSPNTSKV